MPPFRDSDLKPTGPLNEFISYSSNPRAVQNQRSFVCRRVSHETRPDMKDHAHKRPISQIKIEVQPPARLSVRPEGQRLSAFDGLLVAQKFLGADDLPNLL